MAYGIFTPSLIQSSTPFEVSYITGITTLGIQTATWDAGSLNIPQSGWVIAAAQRVSSMGGIATSVLIDDVPMTKIFAFSGTSNIVTPMIFSMAYVSAGSHNFKVTIDRAAGSQLVWGLTLYFANKQPVLIDSAQLAAASVKTRSLPLTFTDNSYGLYLQNQQTDYALTWSNAIVYNEFLYSSVSIRSALRTQVTAGVKLDETVIQSTAFNSALIGISVRGL